MIYVLRTKGAPFLKVGFTETDMERRMAGLQTGCPYELELIDVRSGTLQDEKYIHDDLKKFRTAGEWFKACDVTYRKLGISEDAKPLDPKKEGIVPTYRQFKLSKRFSTYRNADPEMIIFLKDFCEKHKCEEDEVFSIDPKYAEFEIYMMSSRAIFERFRYYCREPLCDTVEFTLIAKWRLKSERDLKNYVPPKEYKAPNSSSSK